MQKFLKLSTVSISAIVAATNANAAGYTCEELIEYTSCNPGYYLDFEYASVCPEEYFYATGICSYDYSDPSYGYDQESCEAEDGIYYEYGCMSYEMSDFVDAPAKVMAICAECPAGSSCAGGTEPKTECSPGTYQPNTKQITCLTTPAGNYSQWGAAQYTACEAGTYQPNAGQGSCLTCPAGSYCADVGMVEHTLCEIGQYQEETGAKVCKTCYSTYLEDIDGNTVVATTAAKGSKTRTDCYIGDDILFRNNKGIYKFSKDCHFVHTTFFSHEAASESECMDGYSWVVDNTGAGYCISFYRGYCEEQSANAKFYWDTELGVCNCKDGLKWVDSNGSDTPGSGVGCR